MRIPWFLCPINHSQHAGGGSAHVGHFTLLYTSKTMPGLKLPQRAQPFLNQYFLKVPIAGKQGTQQASLALPSCMLERQIPATGVLET